MPAMEGLLVDLASSGPDEVGGKARGVHWLMTHRARVPRSWGVTYEEVRRVVAGASLTSPTRRRLAVRSSANREDGQDSSLAGQLASVLNVAPDELSDAIRAVHASSSTSAVAAYLEVVPGQALELAVLLQEMVEPTVSGVSFSRNPVTGLNEVIIEAVEGAGEQLVQGGVTPERWVWRWGSWAATPTDRSLPEPVAQSIASETIRLADAYGRPVDLEWVWDGEDVWWVQIRPIVGIDDIEIFSNRISREVLPGMVKPLVWSVNVPVVNGAWIRLITDAIGPNDLTADDLARQFAYRAYFNMGTMGRIFEQLGMRRDLLEVLLGLEGENQPSFRPSLGVIRHVPRMAALAARLLRHERTARHEIPRLRRRYAAVTRGDLEELEVADLLTRADRVMTVTEDAAYLNIVTPLLANLWSGRLRRALDKRGIDAAAVDITDGRPSPHDPGPAMRALSLRLARTSGAETDDALAEFLERFGHFSDSGNDFSVPTWRDDPTPLIGALASGHDERRGTTLSEALPDAPRAIRRSQKRAVRFQELRDEVSSLYTEGYGRLRPIMLEVGHRLTQAGVLEAPDDVFFATLDELRSVPPDLADRIRARRSDLEAVRDIAMPETIFGDSWSPVTIETSGRLTGVGTSRGQHRGRARVVRGLDDGHRIEDGDVLVVPFSDVGWTPLFLKAGAVVSQSGGMLAHASIVARELGIPCVVSVEAAMAIPDGATVWVDGMAGEVLIEDPVA